MDTYSEILRAVGDASDYLRADGHIPDIVTSDTDLYASLADLTDEEIVPNYALELGNAWTPNQIVVRTLGQMAMIYHAMGEVCRVSFSQDDIYGDVDHERTHTYRAESLGFQQLRYGVMLMEARIGRVSWRPFSTHAQPTRSVTKLEVGSIVAAPGDGRISDGDRHRLLTMGYQNARDVHERTDGLPGPS